MRRTVIASALISPFFLSIAALATPLATDATARPLSTGVKPAHVLYSPNISRPASVTIPVNAEFVLHLNVDQTGKAQDVQVLQSASSRLDASVAAAVRQFRFRPATLDHQPVATDMTLTLIVQH